ncbi:MAG: hypothetical protein JXD22_10800 [Sedimentisphaerales bacterium]|nr:hypothetical protein [Sedimentisphaerales bacterium]
MDITEILKIPYFRQIIGGHREWLTNYDKTFLKKWDDLFQNNPEAALCEATTRQVFEELDIEIEPYSNNGGPDFKCKKRDCSSFTERYMT